MKALQTEMVALGLLLSACSSSLTVAVERYEVTGGAAWYYEQVHARVPRAKKASFASLLSAVDRYGRLLQSINPIVAALTDLKQKDTEARARIIDQAIEQYRTRVIDAIDREDVVAAAEQLELEWAAMNDALTAQDIVLSGEPIVRVAQQAKETKSLQAAAEAAMMQVEDLDARRELSTSATEVTRALRAATAKSGSAASPDQAQRKALADAGVVLGEAQRAARAGIQGALGSLSRGATLVDRRGSFYQDLSDPYWDYISRYPEAWRSVREPLTVQGTGDTQYIAVFDSPIDPHVKLASVDPLSVIQTNLELSRRVAAVGVAIAGVSTGAFAVPGTAGMLSKSDAGNADYSQLTAQFATLEARNASGRSCLNDVRTWARAHRPASTDAHAVLVSKARELRAFLKTNLCVVTAQTGGQDASSPR